MLNRVMKALQETEVLNSCKTKQQLYCKHVLTSCSYHIFYRTKERTEKQNTFFCLKAVHPQPRTHSDWRYGNCCIIGQKSHQSSTSIKKLAL